MYDIEYFQKVKPLKDKIVSREMTLNDVEKIADGFENIRSRDPYVFNIETTNYCNMTCVMCPRTTLMDRKNIWIDDNEFLKALDQIKTNSDDDLEKYWEFIKKEYGVTPDENSENSFYYYIVSKCLTLHGYGEPILDKKIVERVRACSERGIKTYFSCVPANANVAKAEELMRAGLTVLKFSIDAMDDEAQKNIRGKQSDFTQSYQNIMDILKLKEDKKYETLIVPTMISMSSTDESIDMQRKFVELWKGKDVYAYIKSQDNRWYFEDDDEVKNISHYEKQYCEYPWLALTIMADGSVVPCTQDYNAEIVFGNIKDQSLEQMWNSEKYREFRNWHISGEFPKGHKCNERCDMKKLYTYLDGSS